MINRILTYAGNIPVNQPLPRNKNKLELILSTQISQTESLKSLLHKLYKSRIYNYTFSQEIIGENFIKASIRFETNFHAYDPEFYKIEKLLKKNLKVPLELQSTNIERPEGYNKPEVIHKGVEVKVLYEDGVIYDEQGFDKAISLLTKKTSTSNKTSQNKQASYWETYLKIKNPEKQNPELN